MRTDARVVETRVEEQQPEQRRIAELEASVASMARELATANETIARLRERYQRALEKLALAERRIIAGKAERKVDTNDAQLAFDGAFAELKALEKELAAVTGGAADLSPPPSPPPPPSPDDAPAKKPDGRTTPSKTPTGRRDLSKSSLPVEEYEVLDPALEGKAKRIGFEEVQRCERRRGVYLRYGHGLRGRA